MDKEINKFLSAIFTDKALAAEVAALAKKAGFNVSAEALLALGEVTALSDNDLAAGVEGGAIRFPPMMKGWKPIL